MKAKLTDRDWTLIVGIVVAVIVALILFIMNPSIQTEPDASSLDSKMNPLLNTLLRGITSPGKHNIEGLFQLLF